MAPSLRDPERHADELSPLLCAWFAGARRALPWRVNYTPYEVWISEIMLQQTQMERAVGYFRRWMERLPDVAALAAAPEEDVLRLWEGLGYYSRARNLMAAARRIMAEHGGVFPESEAQLLALPGVGPYTAAAVASIAFGARTACVDANVERVLSRLLNIESPVRREPAASLIRQWALRLVPEGRAREHNQALMELGALVCKKAPRCGACPWHDFCRARHLGLACERPVKDTGPG
ncbi:MAG: A/G-specific adenine glycosylase, partial [Desulfovibrio sp.]|nr:A/G-specific adenine glycosylase [Desulfovibrio sp.]